jgi:uncharacterized membrane protein YedE/YeeE
MGGQMSKEKALQKGIKPFILACIVLSIITIYSIISEIWFLIALPVGFLFGFFLQKGDLCGSSAFSEVLLLKDRSKVFGLWMAILVSMVGITILDLLGLVQLNPKPMFWANYLIGGIIFGVGMVLAGGCVSGCLYKTGTGNINSMAGLVGIPIGIALVEHGPLNTVFLAMKKYVISNADGGPVTVTSVTGIPFWLMTLAFFALTVIAVFVRKKNSNISGEIKKGTSSTGFIFKSWKPWIAGILIGILVIPAYLSSSASGRNYPLGVTHGVLHVQLLATDTNLNHVWQKQAAVKAPNNNESAQVPASPIGKKVSWWLILLVSGVVVGSWNSARLSNTCKLLPKPPEQTVVAFLGGILVGIGAAFATGCVIGNIISGWALMSVGLVIFGVVTILMNWLTTYLYLMGGTPMNGKPANN